jgi:hypothetical protein
MKTSRILTIDGNQAAAEIAHLSMGELADEWSSHKQPNV